MTAILLTLFAATPWVDIQPESVKVVRFVDGGDPEYGVKADDEGLAITFRVPHNGRDIQVAQLVGKHWHYWRPVNVVGKTRPILHQDEGIYDVYLQPFWLEGDTHEITLLLHGGDRDVLPEFTTRILGATP